MMGGNKPLSESKKEEKDMSNAAKVSEFLDQAKVFYFLTTDGDQPKGRPFGFHMLVDDK